MKYNTLFLFENEERCHKICHLMQSQLELFDSNPKFCFSAPSFWENTWQACGLASQSPIDIPFSLEYLDTLQPFTFTGYDNFTADDLTLKNNGHTSRYFYIGPVN